MKIQSKDDRNSDSYRENVRGGISVWRLRRSIGIGCDALGIFGELSCLKGSETGSIGTREICTNMVMQYPLEKSIIGKSSANDTIAKAFSAIALDF